MQSSKRALQSAHRIVKKFSKSVKANEKLISRCGLKLIGDCPTRWNSTHAMISRLLAVRPHLTEVLQELEWDDLPTSEWKVLENYRDLLEPFARYTDLMGGEEYTTLSMVVPILLELNYHLSEVNEWFLVVSTCKYNLLPRQHKNVAHVSITLLVLPT